MHSFRQRVRPVAVTLPALFEEYGYHHYLQTDRGFEISEKYVVGYGLDDNQRYRNLPCIGVLKPKLMER